MRARQAHLQIDTKFLRDAFFIRARRKVFLFAPVPSRRDDPLDHSDQGDFFYPSPFALYEQRAFFLDIDARNTISLCILKGVIHSFWQTHHGE
ncbi:hypothetical protein U27_05264 [Candidatus Vecturithrix granuli]|uniref:Uncharacterized protein n=1 Tax=Vecturithrix granuli TaxID=1499967 RepID=A0A081C136_VECG1|nr:hypothetical protein U27_05264 [Candidatus Vecturithrix granuli]